MKKLSLAEQFNIYIQSGFPLVAMDTVEVDRATEVLQKLTDTWNKELPNTNVDDYLKTSGWDFKIWDCYNGLYNKSEDGSIIVLPDTKDPIKVLEFITTNKAKAGIYVIQNFHFFWKDQLMLPLLVQLVREIYYHCKSTHKNIFFVGSSVEIPPEIQRMMVVMDFNLPSKTELYDFIDNYTTELGLKFKPAELTEAATASLGMTTHEVEGAVCVSVVSSKGKSIDKDVIFNEKANAVKRSGLLEYIPTDENMESVGGLTYIKEWFTRIAKAYKNPEKAEKYKLPTPKGCLVAGVSGTGKSLSAKAISNLFGVPLFRCDVGKVFGGIVGETERNSRELFKLIDAVAPCVILID